MSKYVCMCVYSCMHVLGIELGVLHELVSTLPLSYIPFLCRLIQSFTKFPRVTLNSLHSPGMFSKCCTPASAYRS